MFDPETDSYENVLAYAIKIRLQVPGVSGALSGGHRPDSFFIAGTVRLIHGQHPDYAADAV